MKTNMLARVRQHFDRPHLPRSVVRHNQRQWVRAIRLLGDRWLLAKPINGARS